MGRSVSGTAVATTTKLPVRIPALPKPAIARPIMRLIESGASAQSKDPPSNITKAKRYDHLMENNVKTRPNNG